METMIDILDCYIDIWIGKLYEDFFELFETDMFHMGGDEVNLNCWNSSAEIRQFALLWKSLLSIVFCR